MSSCGSCSGSAPHPRPPPPALSSLRVCPDQTPMLLSTQLTLLLQPFLDPSSHSGSSSRSSDREQVSLPSAPLSLFISSSCAGSVGSFLTPSVCAHWSLCPRARSSAPEHRKVGPAVPSRSSRGHPCPLASHSPQWVPLTIYECPHLPPSYEYRKAPQPSVFCPTTPALAVSFSRMFSQRISGLPCLPRKVKSLSHVGLFV